MNAHAAIVIALALLTGCQASKPPPPAYNVHVKLADALRDESGQYPAVDVFMRGVSEWERTQYWQDPRDVAAHARHRRTAAPNEAERVLRLGGDQRAAKTLGAEDGAWQAWADRGATFLVVDTNYPREPVTRDGRDRRVLVIPLAREQYPDMNLSIEVTGDGLDLRTPPRPPPAPKRR